MLDVDFGYWLAGFIDGEGCFTIHCNKQRGGNSIATYGCHFAIALRADDRAIAQEIQSRTGLGTVYARKAYDYEKNPQVAWRVVSKPDAIGLARILDTYPLRAKKASDYAIWREALQEWQTVSSPGVQHDWARMAALKAHLEASRRFDAASRPPVVVPELPASLWVTDGRG